MLFFTIGQFKFDGRDIPQTGVEPFGIVDLIDELAQIGRSLLKSLIVLEVDLLLSTPPSLTLMSLGGILLVIATALILARRQLHAAWQQWE